METGKLSNEPQQTQPNSTGVVNEVKLGPGIYFTDYRKPSKEGESQCKIQLSEPKSKGRELSNNPEVLVADFKEILNRIDKLKYTISEIEAFEGYEKDQEFLSAIDEDYELIVKNYQELARILEQLERIDSKNLLLQNHNAKDILSKAQEATDKHKDFQSKYMNKASVFV